MFTKMKKNMAKKLLIILWLLVTTLYTIYGVYSYFKYRVYEAGGKAAIVRVVSDVVSKQCSESTQLFAGNTTVNLIDISCLQQTSNSEAASE